MIQGLDQAITLLLAPVQRSRDASSAWSAIVDLWRRDVARQMDAGAVDGQRWPSRVSFGDSPGGPSRLQKSGVLRRAWLGGPGSITEIGDSFGRLGVDGRRLPYAVVHRGTSGPITAATFRKVTKIRVTPKMRKFLAAAKGVYLRSSTTFLRVPARPHGIATPEVVGQAADVYRSHLMEEA